MADRHSNDDETPPTKAGGNSAQSIVELLSATASGLVFWSRHPFEMAAEVQLRVRGDILPGACQTNPASRGGWVMRRAFVVQCKPARRADGSVGFHVSVLFVPTLSAACPAHPQPARTTAAYPLDPELVKRMAGLN